MLLKEAVFEADHSLMKNIFGKKFSFNEIRKGIRIDLFRSNSSL